MDAALNLGSRSLGLTAPNPAVGAILVKDGAVVGRGATAPGGRPHAERIAIDQAHEAARGATLYVTLEPCSHFGASPPCVDAVHRGRRGPRRLGNGGPQSACRRAGARAPQSRGDRGLRRRRGGSGAARPSGPYPASDGGPAVRDAQARGDGGRLRLRRFARCAPAHHRTDRRPARPGHALDPRGDHGRDRDGAHRRSGADRAAAWARSQAAARRPRHPSAPARTLASRRDRGGGSDPGHRRRGGAGRTGLAASGPRRDDRAGPARPARPCRSPS